MRALLVLCAVLAVAGTAAATDRTIAPLPSRVAAVSAWHGHGVLTVYDQTAEAWTLWEATAATGLQQLPIPDFDNLPEADVGSDADGRPVVVYLRCEDVLGFHCRIYELALDQGGAREELVPELDAPGTGDVAPTIFAGRIAFGRMRGNAIATVYVQRSPGSRSLRLLDRGTVPRCTGKGCMVFAAPEAMDLGTNGLAMVWHLAGGDAIPQDAWELRRVPLNGAPGRLLDVGVAGECGGGSDSFTRFDSPAMAGPRVAYLRTRGDCSETASAFVFGGPGPLDRQVHPVGGTRLAYAAAFDGARWWWVRGPRPVPSAPDSVCQHQDCALVVSSKVGFRRAYVATPPQPPIEPEVFGVSGGPRTPGELHRYLQKLYSIFRVRPRAIDELPPLARRQLGRGAGSRFLARLAGYRAYVVPHGATDLCLALVGRELATSDCEPAAAVAAGANVFSPLTLPHRRLLFIAVLPDGSTRVVVGNPEGYRRVLHPYRNTVARLLPGSQGSHDWTLGWTRHGRRFTARFT